MRKDRQTDVLIAGAGIAGASAAYFLAPHCRVTLIEREDQPGYHTTGRSAALFAESYGNAAVRALTRASRAFLASPPARFAANAILAPRGHLVFGGADQAAALDAIAEEFAATGTRVQSLPGSRVRELVPALRKEHAFRGLLDAAAQDMDVHALHQGFLRGARANGARLVTNAELRSAEYSAGRWDIDTGAGEFGASVLVNAAGAWVDEVARACGAAPIDIQPLRRTAIVFECAKFPGDAAQLAHWPMAVDAAEALYFRPEAGRFLASPADETVTPPCDAQPDELDVAMLIERLRAATNFEVRRITSKWAGLRSFVADRTPVVGFDPRQPAFFWLAGQGGYGIQTCPAMGIVAAALVRGRKIPDNLRDEGVAPATLDPRRLAKLTRNLPV